MISLTRSSLSKLAFLPLQPNWWGLSKAHQQTLSALADNGDAEAAEGVYFASPALEAAPIGVWSAPYVEGPKRPPPRYEHASAVIGSQLYIFGGNCGGSPASSLEHVQRKLPDDHASLSDCELVRRHACDYSAVALSLRQHEQSCISQQV